MEQALKFKGNEVIVSTKEHYQNNRTVIELILKKSKEPYMVASVNLPHIALEKDEVLIKNYSENEGVLDFLIASNIVELLDKNPIQQGWVSIPICKLIKK